MRQQGKLDEAIAEYRRAIALDDSEPLYRVFLAYTLALASRCDEALSEAQAAVNLAPDDAFAHAILGVIRLLTGQLQEAETTLRMALSLEDAEATPLARAALAYCLVRQRKPEEARAELVKVADALAEERPNDDLLYFAAKAYSELGETEQAQTLAGRFVEQLPRHPWAAEMRELMQ